MPEPASPATTPPCARSTTLNISSVNPPGSPPTALFHNADIAMYHAKSSHTGTAIAYRMGHAGHVDHVADNPA